MTLQDIWCAFSWTHPRLKSKDELCSLELETEREMLVPALKMCDIVNECRSQGCHVIFISDMYLSSKFLCEVMREHGFFQDGDSLYVSCECNAEKTNGEVFKYIREKEGLSFRRWHHYGDNMQCDYKVPRKLGIKSTLVKYDYTPYQKQWMENDYSLGFKYQGVMSGIGRALHYSTKWTTHTDFVLDIIAPFYCSLVYRMMKDAEQRGIKRLYFCARDAYMMYEIAKHYSPLFSSIECRFLYISRKALYEGDDKAKLSYYEQVGLATKKDYIGIVDIRSSGKTLQFLNQFLSSKGFKPVRGYYFELFIARIPSFEISDYYCELSGIYNPFSSGKMVDTWQIWESFMPMNSIQNTVDYEIIGAKAQPLFGSDETDGTPKIQQTQIIDHGYWCTIHESLIHAFACEFISTGLWKYADSVFKISINTAFSFIDKPRKQYLLALEDLYGVKEWESRFVPFVRKESWLRLLHTHGKDSIWKYGTLIYNNFYDVIKFVKSLRRR